MIKNILKFFGKGIAATIGTVVYAMCILILFLSITDMWEWVIKTRDKVAE